MAEEETAARLVKEGCQREDCQIARQQVSPVDFGDE